MLRVAEQGIEVEQKAGEGEPVTTRRTCSAVGRDEEVNGVLFHNPARVTMAGGRP